MRKLFTLFATSVLFASGAMTANARYWTYDFSNPVAPSAIESGRWYCLQGGASAFNGGYTAFLNGESIVSTSYLSTDNLFKFVPTGEKTADGSVVYYVQNYAGNYLYGLGQRNFFGDAIDRAWKVTVKSSKSYSDEYEYSNDDADYTGIEAYAAEARDTGSAFDYTIATYCEVDNAVVIANYESNDPEDAYATYSYLCGLGDGVTSGTASRDTDYDTNAWLIYTVSELSAMQSLEAAMANLTDGTLSIDLSSYPVGDGVGEFDATLYSEFVKLWKNALALYNEERDATDEEIDAVAEALPVAYNAFCKSGKGFEEGYYIFYNVRATGYENTDWPWVDNYNDYGHDGGCMFDGSAVKTSDLYLRWSLFPDDVNEATNIFIGKDANGKAVITDINGNLTDENGIPYQLCANTAKYVWHATKSNKKDNEGNTLFYLQNIVTENYIGSAESSDYTIHMTGKPETGYALAANEYVPGWFCIYSPSLPVYADYTAPSAATYSGLHTSKWADSVTYWDARNAGSSWRVISLSEEDYQTLMVNVASAKIMFNLQSTLKKAENTLIKSYTYDIFNADGTKNTTAESNSLELDGLLTSGSQMSSKASDNSYGGFDYLFDGDENTFWCTHYYDWDDTYKGDPYFQFILDEEEIALHFKTVMYEDWYSGWFYGDYDAPLTFDIYATDDESLLDVVDVDGDDKAWEKLWTKLGSSEFDYQYTSVNGGWDNNIGTCSYFFDKKYKNFRLVFKERVTEYAGGFYAMSEFRVHRVSIDYANSLLNAVPMEIIERLQAAIEKAKKEVDEGVATQETYEELLSAYNDFLDHFPDPTRITDAVEAAKELTSAAVEGSGLGYYDDGAIADLEKAIKEAEAGVKEVMTVEEINAVLAALNAALDKFNAALHVPAAGLYVIKSKSETTALVGRSICAANSSEQDAVQLLGRVENGDAYADENNAALRPGIYWQVEKAEAGFTFKNLYTGKYLCPVSGTTTLSQSTDPYVFGMQFAKAPGCFNLVLDKEDAKSGTYIYLYASESTLSLKATDSANGADNAAFEFVPQTASEVDNAMNDGGLLFDVEFPSAPQLYTFTLDMDTYVDGDAGVFYSVIGQDPENNIQLKAEEGTLTAGQAYVYVPAEGATSKSVLFFMPEGNLFSTLSPTTNAKSNNGLTGTFETVTLPEKCGVFNTNHTKVLISEEGESVVANTGYFVEMPETGETGDALIPANGRMTSTNGITTVVIKRDQKGGIYTISGLRLRDMNHLPAGLYIVNGKKYMVK